MREIKGMQTYDDGQFQIQLSVDGKRVNVILQEDVLELENETGNFYFDYRTGKELGPGEF